MTSYDSFLYYLFHIVYLGYPFDILGRLWLAYDRAHSEDAVLGESEKRKRHQEAWKVFDEAMRESHRATSVLAALVAATAAALLSVDGYTTHAATRILLLSTLTSSIISATACISLLSTILTDYTAIELRWKILGMLFVVSLSGPSAWLSISLWCFQASLVAIVWLSEGTVSRVIITGLLGARLAMKISIGFMTRLRSSRGSTAFSQQFDLLGMGDSMNHHLTTVNPNSIKYREKYRHQISRDLQELMRTRESVRDADAYEIPPFNPFAPYAPVPPKDPYIQHLTIGDTWLSTGGYAYASASPMHGAAQPPAPPPSQPSYGPASVPAYTPDTTDGDNWLASSGYRTNWTAYPSSPPSPLQPGQTSPSYPPHGGVDDVANGGGTYPPERSSSP